MTKERAKEMSDWLLKILMPVFIAICSFVLYTAATELRELRNEIQNLRVEYLSQLTQIEIKIAKLQSQLDFHDRAEQ